MSNDIKYVLDVSVLLNFLANEPLVVEKMLSLEEKSTYLTPIAIAEAYYGLMIKKIDKSDALSILLKQFGVIPINSDVAIQFACLKKDACITGRNMDRDLWMVAFCKHVGATLLTTDATLRHRLRHIDPPIEVIAIGK